MTILPLVRQVGGISPELRYSAKFLPRNFIITSPLTYLYLLLNIIPKYFPESKNLNSISTIATERKRRKLRLGTEDLRRASLENFPGALPSLLLLLSAEISKAWVWKLWRGSLAIYRKSWCYYSLRYGTVGSHFLQAFHLGPPPMHGRPPPPSWASFDDSSLDESSASRP